MRTVLLARQHLRQLHAVADQLTKMANSGWRDKGRLGHAAHEQVAYPAGILAVGLIALLRLCVLWMSKRDMIGLLQDIKNRYPILAG